ncbi:MAG: hypothetical protein AB7O98_04540 [Hyphomonadaceae bacterium]
MSDKELENLHANAVRLAQSGTPIQQRQAEELLPRIGAAMEARQQARESAKKQARRAATKHAAVSGVDLKKTSNEPD